jgi:hypothetical protein
MTSVLIFIGGMDTNHPKTCDLNIAKAMLDLECTHPAHTLAIHLNTNKLPAPPPLC